MKKITSVILLLGCTMLFGQQRAKTLSESDLTFVGPQTEVGAKQSQTRQTLPTNVNWRTSTAVHNFSGVGVQAEDALNTVEQKMGPVIYSTTEYNGTANSKNGANLIYETGPYFNVPGNPDISLLENTTLGMNTLGGGVQIANNNRMADDIVLDDEYEITQIDFFGYQTGEPTSPASINEINLQVWDGDPSDPTSTVIWGDASTNVFGSAVWSNAYRESETTPGTNRAIQRVTVNPVGLTLPAGTYWFDWSMAGTGGSGPWQPPVVILGQTTTGNAQQSLAGTWGPWLDTGTSTQLGAPVQVFGNLVGGGGGCVAGSFADRTAFETAFGGSLNVEDFQGGPTGIAACDGPINEAGNSCFAPGEILAGIEVTTSTPAEPDPMVFVEAGNFGNADNIVGANQFASYTILNFPNDDVNSFGFDLFALTAGSDVEVRIFGTSGLIESFTLDVTSGGPVFFGYISAETVTSVELEDLTGANAELIGLVAFGECSVTPPADNDLCADAFAIACDETLSGDTSDGNTDTNGDGAPDEWFSFTGSGSPQVVTVSLCGSAYDTILTAYDDCSLATVVATNDDSCGLQSEISFLSDGTTTYYFAVDGFAGATGAFDISVTCVDPPVNDTCEGALPIACGETIAGTTNNATVDSDVAPDCVTSVTAPGVWYVFEDTSDLVTDITISMCNGNTSYDSKLSVYTGDCGAPPLTCVTGNDDTCGLQSEVSFQSDGNTTFYILVHGFGGATGDFELEMNCTIVPPPNDMIANSIDVDEAGFPYTDPQVQMPGATTENGNPTGCNIDGANGVWYNFVPEGDGTATASIVSPAGLSFVSFYEAPDENATETDLVLVNQNSNQCVPGTETTINTTAGQAYYVFVVNTGGKTDITIDGTNLGIANNTIEGFTYFPNPASSTLNLNSVETIEAVSIYNMLGQSVVDMAIDATSSQLDISGLSTGTYVMKVIVNGQVGTYQIIKE